MLDLILHNNSIITFITILLFVNIILTNSTEITKNQNKSNKKDSANSIEKFKDNIIDFFILILCLTFLYVAYKIKNIFSFFMFITIILSFSRIFKNYAKDDLYLNYESKQHYISATCFFTILFSAKACDIYINSLSSLPHTIKEILLLIYLITKIIFVIFFFLMNFSIIISNMKMLFGNRLSNLMNKLKKINLVYEPIYYNFIFSSIKNNNLVINIDKIIFFITCPIFMIFNIILKLLLTILKKIINSLIKTYHFLLNYDNNRTLIIKTILKISLILSLILVYICIIYEYNIFSNQIKEIYNLISTVILIPIIYDSIKHKKK